jgi:hypothetical protein
MDTMNHPIARILGITRRNDGMKPFVYPSAKYPLKDRISISFSGGKTSAYMTKMLLDHFRKHEPEREISVVFANTGQEHEETLKFVERCDREFGFGVVWIEAVVNPQKGKGIRHKVVNFDTAARNGEPFEAYIAKHGIPNTMYKQCNSRLKTEPMYDYRRSCGWTSGTYSTAVGIRADEIDRISMKGMTEMGLFYPCADAGVTKEDVREWWSKQSFNLNIPEHWGNCFPGETRFMTTDGLVSFDDTAGETLEVLTRDGWRNARISSFGKQRIFEVKVKRGAVTKIIRTTAGHRWIVSKYHNGNRKWLTDKITTDLRVNDNIPLNWKDLSDVELDPEGIRHGFSFGDGSLDRDRVRTYVAECKEEILPYFGNPKLGKARLVEKLPSHYKTVPTGQETWGYLKGFVAGLIASDGHVCATGVLITNAVEDNAVRIGHVLDCLGLPHNMTHAVRDTNYKKAASLYTISISTPLIPDDMVLRSTHASNRPSTRTNPKGWKVVSVSDTGESEEVFCATVLDGPDEFTLEGGIITRNCKTCWKKSDRKLLTLARSNPEFFAFFDRMEKTYALAGGERKDGECRKPRVFFRKDRSVQDLLREAAEGNFTSYEDDKFIPFDDELDVGGSCGESCEIGADED